MSITIGEILLFPLRALQFIFLFCLLLFSVSVAAVNTVYLSEVRQSSVVIEVNDRALTLNLGDTKNGVTLTGLHGQTAVLEIDGYRHRLRQYSQIQLRSSYQEPASNKIEINADDYGHFQVQAKVNGVPVNFMVDTGASFVAINESTAKRLRLNYQNAKTGISNTANGQVKVKLLTIDRISIAGITQTNVKASVRPDNLLPTMLLGNSFLSSLSIRMDDGVMTIKRE